MLTVLPLPLTSFNAKVPLFSSCHSPTLPLHLHFYPGSPHRTTSIAAAGRAIISSLFWHGKLCSSMATCWFIFLWWLARGLVLLSRPLYACSHTVLWTENGCWVFWIIIFIYQISFWKVWKRSMYLGYLRTIRFSTQTMCTLDLVGDNIFWKSAKFIDWKTGWYDISLSRQLLLQRKRKTSITTIWMSLTRKLLILSVSLQKRK